MSTFTHARYLRVRTQYGTAAPFSDMRVKRTSDWLAGGFEQGAIQSNKNAAHAVTGARGAWSLAEVESACKPGSVSPERDVSHSSAPAVADGL